MIYRRHGTTTLFVARELNTAPWAKAPLPKANMLGTQKARPRASSLSEEWN